jgi:hypothetical protein
MPTLTLLTPTFARDYERFCLQRESMARCGITLAHVAIVNHEDLPQFQNVPHRENLQVISSADVLPARLEKRRRAWGFQRRRHPQYWFAGRGIHGWGIQQLLKLGAARITDADAIICLDSDTFFVDRVVEEDFYAPDGRLHLYETSDDLDVQMSEWYAHALRFLGFPTVGVTPRRFTHSPVPWRRDVLIDLQKTVEKGHGGDWLETIADADRIMEYTLYGTFARHIDQLARHAPVKPPTLYYWWPEEGRTLEQDFASRVAAAGAKIVLVNSNMNLPVSRYRELVQRAWTTPAQA